MTATLGLLVLSLIAAPAPRASAEESPEKVATEIIARFERALKDHDLPSIAALVADDIVVFENGHRNEGWKDFRDNHLAPEMEEPSHSQKTGLVKVSASPQMAWGYSRTEVFGEASRPAKATHLLWSVYILEPRREGWRIVSLDWSIAKVPKG